MKNADLETTIIQISRLKNVDVNPNLGQLTQELNDQLFSHTDEKALF